MTRKNVNDIVYQMTNDQQPSTYGVTPTPHAISSMIFKLSLYFHSQPLSKATGFLLKHSDSWYLVTNWHVLSGRNVETLQPMSKHGGLPNWLSYRNRGIHGNTTYMHDTRFDLYDSEGKCLWYEHPSLGCIVDIAVLPLPDHNPNFKFDILNSDFSDDTMWIDLGDDLLIAGYPLGLSSAGMMPLWKHGVLSSSTEIGHAVDRFFFVDAATNPGMSGSPVFSISKGIYYKKLNDDPLVYPVFAPYFYKFLGIYSGRILPIDGFSKMGLQPQIAKVFIKNKIIEIIEGRKIPEHTLEPPSSNTRVATPFLDESGS